MVPDPTTQRGASGRVTRGPWKSPRGLDQPQETPTIGSRRAPKADSGTAGRAGGTGATRS